MGYQHHILPYQELETAFTYAYEIALMDLKDSDDAGIQNALKDFTHTKYSSNDIRKLSYYYHSQLMLNDSYDTYAVYESLILWYLKLKEEMASRGDIDSMIALYDEYRSVGNYTVKDSPYSSTGKFVYFSGNKQRGIYWLEKAVAAGDITATRLMGEDWQYIGISELEGQAWLKKAVSMGDSIAADTLRIAKEQKAKQAAFEKNVREYLSSQQQNPSSSEKKDLDAVHTVHHIPAIITGPYNNTYTRTSISSLSAEYTNQYGEIVVIKNSDIGFTGRSANTVDGYFYW